MNTPQIGNQNRNAYRLDLAPFEIKVIRLWIHDPGVRFKKDPIAPLRHVLELANGVHVLNISAGGMRVRISAPSQFSVLQLIRQQVSDEEQATRGEEQDAPPDPEQMRDISILLDHDGGNLLISCNIVRCEFLRGTRKTNLYDLALRFHMWGHGPESAMQWLPVRDGVVPPLAAWGIRRQLSKNAMRKL